MPFDQWIARDLFNEELIMFDHEGVGRWEFGIHRTFPQAPRAPFRLKLSRLPSFPQLHARIAAGYAEAIRREKAHIQRLAYVSSTMAPTAGIISAKADLPLLLCQHDALRWDIQGNWDVGDRVGILDHFRLRDQPKESALSQIAARRMKAAVFFVMIDFNDAHPSFPWWDMLSYFHQQGMITVDAYDASSSYCGELCAYMDARFPGSSRTSYVVRAG